MAVLRIYNEITDEETKLDYQSWLGLETVCFKDVDEFLASMEDDDNEIDLRIHCAGGNCDEGWAVYDKLRTSGKGITATIDGECSSMATVLLLAAPKERRFGMKHASLCVHDPASAYLPMVGGIRLTYEELEKVKSDLAEQQKHLLEEKQRILNLYVERTGTDRETLEKLMGEDKYIGMEEAKELGFIGAILEPNTAIKKRKFNVNKKNQMAKEKITIENRVVKKLLALSGLAKIEDVKIVDQKITAADGTEFTVEREDGDPQVGDRAYPNGTYVLEDGTEIVVADELVESVTPAESDDDDEEAEDLKEQVTSLTDEVSALTKQVKALQVEKEALENKAKKDDEQKILDIVKKAGGLSWLEAMKDTKSTFNASNRKFVEHANKTKVVDETKMARLLREQREKQEAKRNAMKK